MTQADFYTALPLTLLVAWACVLLLLDLFIPKDRKGLTAALAALGLALTLGFTLAQIGQEPSTGYKGMIVLDGFSIFINALLLVSGLLGIGLSFGYIKRMNLERGEYYTLMLFSISGMMLMAQAGDLIVVFLALELLSIPLYVLAAFDRPRVESEEAGLKYFLLGAFATGFVVYGTALVFGATGTTSLNGIVTFLGSHEHPGLLLTIGAALILVGLGFKIAAVPFHMWTPDVYQGSPTAVTAFMASGAKIGLRRIAACVRHCVPIHRRGYDRRALGDRRSDDDPRQPGRHLAEQHQTHAGLFQHRPRRVHSHGVCSIWKS